MKHFLLDVAMKKLIFVLAACLIFASNEYSGNCWSAKRGILAKVKVEYSHNDYIPSQNHRNMWGYKSYDDFVIAAKYQDAGPFMEGLAAVKLGGKYGYIDMEGRSVIPYKYHTAGVFSEGLACVSMNGKYGYVDREGKQVIPYKFSDAGDFIDGMAEVIFDGQRGYVDKNGKWYSNRNNVFSSFSGFARHFVEEHVNKWQKKGKFEKTSAWQKRVNDSSREKLVDSLLSVAKINYVDYQKENISQDFRLGDYDADGEIFMVYDRHFGNLLVPVPIAEAEDFERNFRKVVRHDVYCVSGDGLGLSEAVFVTPSGRSYKYSNSAVLEFTSVDIKYNFDEIDVDYNADDVQRGSQMMKKKSISVGKSDVDQGVPESRRVNDNTFAVILANENYHRVSPVEYAINDGQTFKEYCVKTLGIPEKNIRFVKDATLVNVWEQVDWITGVAKAFKGEARLIFYYAGHGVPDEKSKDSFLLPVDGIGGNAQTGYKLSELYARLSENPVKSATVFLDACFSGAGRSGDVMLASRSVAIKPNVAAPKGNMVVFSASSNDETAYPYHEKGHGLFTYFLCKKLQETEGKVTLGELAEYVEDNVYRHSLIENSKAQTPTVNASGSLLWNWKTVQF